MEYLEGMTTLSLFHVKHYLLDCPKCYRLKGSIEVQGSIRLLIGSQLQGGITLSVHFLDDKELNNSKGGESRSQCRAHEDGAYRRR